MVIKVAVTDKLRRSYDDLYFVATFFWDTGYIIMILQYHTHSQSVFL